MESEQRDELPPLLTLSSQINFIVITLCLENLESVGANISIALHEQVEFPLCMMYDSTEECNMYCDKLLVSERKYFRFGLGC